MISSLSPETSVGNLAIFVKRLKFRNTVSVTKPGKPFVIAKSDKVYGSSAYVSSDDDISDIVKNDSLRKNPVTQASGLPVCRKQFVESGLPKLLNDRPAYLKPVVERFNFEPVNNQKQSSERSFSIENGITDKGTSNNEGKVMNSVSFIW